MNDDANFDPPPTQAMLLLRQTQRFKPSDTPRTHAAPLSFRSLLPHTRTKYNIQRNIKVGVKRHLFLVQNIKARKVSLGYSVSLLYIKNMKQNGMKSNFFVCSAYQQRRAMIIFISREPKPSHHNSQTRKLVLASSEIECDPLSSPVSSLVT